MPDDTARQEIYRIWAPPGELWSPWVKPVLFACMEKSPPGLALSSFDGLLDWLPQAEEKVAVVLDLPRDEGVVLGLEFARRGYRPVTLYNAIPVPTWSDLEKMGTQFPTSHPVVEVTPIRDALFVGTKILQQLSIPPDAPPVFLLDANRRGGNSPSLTPGNFDNRSVSFTTDFPSALFLQTHGISRALLVQRSGQQPQPDLAHTLRRWQDVGIAIQIKLLDQPGGSLPGDIERPSWFGAMWYRFKLAFGLQRHELGGYGGIIGLSSGG